MKPVAAKTSYKKKDSIEVVKVYKYGNIKIKHIKLLKSGWTGFTARFKLDKKEFTPKAETRRDLEEIIDEIRANQRRGAYDLPVAQYEPSFAALVEKHKPKISKQHQRNIFERVSQILLDILPLGIKITELKKAHFQKYIELRRSQTGKQTGKPILDETIDKELFSVSSALRDAPLYFTELDDYKKPEIPKAHKGKKRRRTRLVSKDKELQLLLSKLREPRSGKQTLLVEYFRHRLADQLEFKFETGLRRKEVIKLEKKQYFPEEKALRDVMRWKTGTVTPFFPLSRRASEIIEARLKTNAGAFIFSDDGAQRESEYRTLKDVCEELGIPYGRHVDGGFVAHDLRHNFASEVISGTDIETARELLGHSNIAQTGAYLHTDEKKLTSAINRREKFDKKAELIKIYKDVRRGKLTAKKYLELLKKIAEF